MQELIMLIKFYLRAKKVTRIVPKHTYKCNEHFACVTRIVPKHTYKCNEHFACPACGWRAEARRNYKRLYAKCSMCGLEVRIPR